MTTFARKTCVEDSIARLSAVGMGPLIRAGAGARGRTPDDYDLKVERVDGSDAIVRVNYVVPVGGLARHGEEHLALSALPSVVGGQRWLWCCPSCDRGVQELYIAPGCLSFACRGCAGGLTYTSRQTRVMRLGEILAREDDVLDRLRRARSPERIRRLQVRARRLARSKHRAMVEPTMALLAILEAAVARSRGRA